MKHSSAPYKSGKPSISLALLVMGVLACQSIGYAQRSESRRSEPDPRAPLTPELAVQLSQNADRFVIVIMKSRVAGDNAAADQAPLMDELRQVKAAGIKPFRLVNAFAATVSEGELARLKAHPAVERVLPDVVIRRKPRASSSASPRAATAASVSPAASPQPVPAVLRTLPGACSSSAQGLLDPEALPLTNTASDDPTALTARSLGFTGAGVKVAALADGVDVNNINFIRANGTSAFIDYRDFSGDGPTAPTFSGEAFVDYNAVAGQGIHVYDVSQFGAQTDPAPCNIRIQGVAPGASLVGLKVLSANFTTTSAILQAIEYAVQTAHVDVLNESLGTNPNPDTSFLDALSLFDDAAVAAGVTVVVSSGDAGPTNTIGTPASDPNVISVGATTSFRFYAQTNEGAARYFATTGWLNDNISAFSSSGFTQTGRTVDLVAPGDTAWMSCDASANYSNCVNFLSAPSDVEVSGGTSLSAPLTAGAAALVIEAYRGAHHGKSPSPALVKQILTSTATDLGVPANEQGAGLLNTYKAVLLAKSIDADAPAGQTLLLSQNQLNAVGLPGTNANWDVTVTNVSASHQTVTASGRTFGPPQNARSGSVAINPPGAQFTYYNGFLYTYQTFTFQVPPGAARLYASIAYSESAVIARLSLIDPNGKFAAFSNPYGIGDAGNVDVRQPAPGAWTGVIFEYSALATPGTVLWQAYTQQFVPFASVSPGAFTLPPGASRTLEISAVTPAAPGDAAGSIVLTGSGGGTDPYLGPESNSIPVTLRSLVDANHGGAFSGTVIGGNGNFPPEGQVAYYQFNVGPGRESITATVSLSNDPQENVGLYLIDPAGAAAGFGTNFDAVTGANLLSATAYVVDPMPGKWTLIVYVGTVAGNEISQPFTGTVTLDQPNLTVSAPAVPKDPGAKLAAGVAVTIPITVSNRGRAPEDVFIDARLNTLAALTLTDQAEPNNFQWTLPFSCCPSWLVPNETISVQVSANADVPVEFDFGPFNGDPDILSFPTGPNHAKGFYSAAPGGMVTPGFWAAVPSEFGPYGAAGAPPGTATVSMVALTKPFDAAVTSSTGDLWLQALNPSSPFAPVSVGPGQTVTINVTITPSGAPGSVVSGVLYVSTLAAGVPPYFIESGDEAVEIPYTYTIGRH